MDSCLIILEQKDDAFISMLQLTMKDQASSSIEKEEMPFKSSEILPVDRGSVLLFHSSHAQTPFIAQHVAGKLTSEEVFLLVYFHSR